MHVVKHGRAVRIRVSTTHPAMANLFESLFSSYGHVTRCPRTAKLVGFEWTLECDLDGSFEFLLRKPSLEKLKRFSRDERLAFLAGLFDAEGSVLLHNKLGRYNPEIQYVNTDARLLEFVREALSSLGFESKLKW